MEDTKTPIQDRLEIPWLGLRKDIILHTGPIDHDGQRTWVLEDPVRGSNYRLGYKEGEILLKLLGESSIDSALKAIYTTTPLRPAPDEVLNFVRMLQKEHLAVLPKESVIREETEKARSPAPPFVQKIFQGALFFRVPLIRPDGFLNRTYPVVSLLWSLPAKGIYLVLALFGLVFTIQEPEQYFGTVDYLLTPQGALSFVLCLVLLKIGHEFAHAYTAKAYGLHVRSMGLYFIVFWPLLYTDTTDAWKLPERSQRIQISIAGVLFEITLGGMAFFFWSVLPDGIAKSLMFFLSSTSVVSTVFINLNPFMRYDGYYVLMDLWGIDNLRPRAAAILRYTIRRIFLGWKGVPPEIHPNTRSMVVYGICAVLYRIMISLSIAFAIYYLLFPVLGMLLMGAAILMLVIVPVIREIRMVYEKRALIGSRIRLGITGVLLACVIFLVFFPFPRMKSIPCLVLQKGTNQMTASFSGELENLLPDVGTHVEKGEIITRIISKDLEYEKRRTAFALEKIKTTIKYLGSAGEQGAYKNWLQEEEKRLETSLEKIREEIALLAVRSPETGKVVQRNEDLYAGATVSRGTFLLTIARSAGYEARAYVHEGLVADLEDKTIHNADIRIPAGMLPGLKARLRAKTMFPVAHLPNEALFDIAGGPIVSVPSPSGRKPLDAFYCYSFDIQEAKIPIAHGQPGRLWIQSRPESVFHQAMGKIRKELMERGVI